MPLDASIWIVDNNLAYDDYSYKVVTDPAENLQILQSYIDRGMFNIGYDAEWFGSKFTEFLLNRLCDNILFGFIGIEIKEIENIETNGEIGQWVK